MLWSAQHFPRLMGLRGKQGTRILFADFAERILEVAMPDDAVLVDIDSEATLETVRIRFAEAEAAQGVP